jgi:hypothetical protein
MAATGKVKAAVFRPKCAVLGAAQHNLQAFLAGG